MKILANKLPQISPILALLAVLGMASACGGPSGFGLSSDDNNPAKVTAALSKMKQGEAGVVNRMGTPMVFLVARGKPKVLVAYDLGAKKERWRTPTEVNSKIVVGRDFVAYREGEKKLVGRDIESGKQLWSVGIDGTFIGAAADANRVYYTAKSGSRSWILKALEGKSGSEAWDAESNGALGAPEAQGGLVFSPFMKQWLAILDAADGKQLARIRGIDEEIAFVRKTGSNVYFGSKSGAFLLDEKAASGKRDSSTYGSVKLPKQLERAHYHWDAFDPVQSGYSAYDRNRILWQGKAGAKGLEFSNDSVAVHTYRFFFGFEASSGDLKWAYNHPRVDIIASSNNGKAIGMVSMLGEIGALDPATGSVSYSAKVEGQFTGGTFDIAGWTPSEEIQSAGSTAAALAGIARDRDARFNEIKKFAVEALSQLKGGDVSEDLLALIQNEKTPAYLVDTAGDVLVERKDPRGAPALISALAASHNYVTGEKPRAVGVIARAIAALEADALSPKQRGKAAVALLTHLHAPQTTPADLVQIVKAIGAVGVGKELEALTSFLLIYRADPSFANQIDAVSATIDVLLSKGGRAERESVAFVAEDARSEPAIADYAKAALVRRPEAPATEESSVDETESTKKAKASVKAKSSN